MEKNETENKVGLPNFKNMPTRGGIMLFLKYNVCNLDIQIQHKASGKGDYFIIF